MAKNVRFRLLACIAGFVALAMAATPGAAQTPARYALLVGVSGYTAAKPLRGPRNDIRLALDMLTGGEHPYFVRRDVTVLADGVDGADGSPTLAAITAAFAALAARVGPGDLVYLHFSGHGSRQKARRPATEQDGLDEVFLPIDTGTPADGRFPNALVDDDIGAAIDAIRSRGAFVFVVFDSCHSASATRAMRIDGMESAEVSRLVSDAAPPARADDWRHMEAPLDGDETARAGMGGLVSFFAAQTIEPTPELPMAGADGDRPVFGLFTHTLFQVIARKPGLSYRELAQGVMHAYAGLNRTQPTPIFEGDLDRPVFGGNETAAILQWPVARASGRPSIAGGSLHGLADDAIVAVLGDPLDPIDEAIGYARLVDVGALQSTLVPVARGGLPQLPDKAFDGVVARPVEVPLTFELKVHLAETEGVAERARLEAREALRTLAADAAIPLNMRMIDNAEEADLELVVASEATLYGSGDDGERLWFLPPDGRFPADRRLMPHSIGLAGGLDAAGRVALKENLAAVFRATSLARLAETSRLDAPDFQVSLYATGSDGEPRVPLADRLTAQAPGAIVSLEVTNGSRTTIDLDVLTVNPDYSISHVMYDRFQPGDGIDSPILRFGATNLGLRQLLIVARETRPQFPRTDLSVLKQVGVQTRGAEPTGARSFTQSLSDIASGSLTRSAIALSAHNSGDLKGRITIVRALLLPSS